MARESAPAIIENRLELENEPDSDDQEIKRLATLPIIQYGREPKLSHKDLASMSPRLMMQ
jgi:hypothetical protein